MVLPPPDHGHLAAFWRRRKSPILLIGLSSLLAGTTVAWLYLDRQPPWWDDSFYLAKSLVMFDALGGGVVGYIKEFFSITPNRPPLITVLPTPFYLIFGRDPKYAFGVNLVFIPVLLGSVYLLGKNFWGERAGLIAACIVGTMPMIYGLSRWYLVEFSLTAMVSFAVCFLVESREFKRFRETLVFGIVCALGLLLKVTFPLFVLPLFLYVYWRSFSASRVTAPSSTPTVPSRLAVISALAVPSLLLALPWYAMNLGPTVRLVKFAGFSADADIYGTGRVFSFGAVVRYLMELTGSGTSYYYALLAILLSVLILATGKTRLFIKSVGRKPLYILVLWGLPFLVFLFGRNKNLRYVSPLMPVFGLALAGTLDFALARLKKGRIAVLCLVAVFPAISVMQKSFFVLGDRFPRLNRFLCVNGPQDVARKYERARWPQKEILNVLVEDARFEHGKNKVIMLGTDRAYFNADNFRLAAVSQQLPFEVTSSAHGPDLRDLLRSLNVADFFIYKQGGEPESPYYNTNQSALVQEAEHGGRFVELPQHWSLPDGGVVHVFKNSTPMWSIVKEGYVPSGVEPISSCKVNFDQQIELTGLSLEQSETALRVRFRWLCLKPPDHDYWCFVHILDDDGKIVGYLDHPLLGGEPPVKSWGKDGEGLEMLQFPVPSKQPHQTLSMSVGLYYPPSGERLAIRNFTFGGSYDASLVDGGSALFLRSPREKH